MTPEREICGDGHLPLGRRLAYLGRNLLRNLTEWGGAPVRERFLATRPAATPALASPGRVLTEAFLADRLTRLHPPGRVRVLDIGCGSGRLCSMLATLGYSGEYVGLDMDDRFAAAEVPGFERAFIQGDAHDFDPGEMRFDLILSVSALEHIPDDARLIGRLPAMLAPGGLELHFVPAGWALPTYLWHGYRQYTLPRIGQRFGGDATVAVSLGGLYTFMLHFVMITLGEMILPLKSRKRLPGLYRRLLDGSLRLDRLLPVCPTMFAVRRGTGARP
jgi:SAM-dependent methyltransferase